MLRCTSPAANNNHNISWECVRCHWNEKCCKSKSRAWHFIKLYIWHLKVMHILFYARDKIVDGAHKTSIVRAFTMLPKISLVLWATQLGCVMMWYKLYKMRYKTYSLYILVWISHSLASVGFNNWFQPGRRTGMVYSLSWNVTAEPLLCYFKSILVKTFYFVVKLISIFI